MQVVDFRTIEIYIDTLAKKNASKMKLAKDQSVHAKVFKAYEKGNNLNLQEVFDKAISVDKYLQNRASGMKPPLRTYLQSKRSRRKAKDSSSDEAEGVAFMEESVTLMRVQQVADAAAASATFGLKKRFEAKFDAITQDLDTLKVNSTEQSLGVKALLQLSKNQTAAAPAAPQYQQYQQPPYQQQPAPAQNASQYQQSYAPQQQYYGQPSGGKGGGKGGKGGKGWRGRERPVRKCYHCDSTEHLV